MAYNRYGNVGGGYPAPNPSGMYNQPPMPAHQHAPPQPYGQPYGNRQQTGVWNMPPQGPIHHPPPQGQNMSPWINNNIPTSFRGYPQVHDNRNQNMGGMKPNLRMVIWLFHTLFFPTNWIVLLKSQGSKRPMDWNNTPNKRRIQGNNLNNQNNQINQKNKPNNSTNSNTPQQQQQPKKPWVANQFSKNNVNRNNNNTFKRRNNSNVKANDKVTTYFLLWTLSYNFFLFVQKPNQDNKNQSNQKKVSFWFQM